MRFPTIFLKTGDPEVAARFEAAVRRRYCEPLYHRIDRSDAETVEMHAHFGPNFPLWVADAPRHAVLSQSLWHEFGAAVESAFREREELTAPYETFLYRVNPAAQHELFERDLEELPEFIAGFFPIVDADSGYQVVLDEVKPEPITNPYTTAWCSTPAFASSMTRAS